jgi:hypothetical protein
MAVHWHPLSLSKGSRLEALQYLWPINPATLTHLDKQVSRKRIVHKAMLSQTIYRVRVEGILDPCWSEWFDGMLITPLANDETLLSGPVRDQAALHGLLVKIRDVGMVLVSIERVDTTNSDRDESVG